MQNLIYCLLVSLSLCLRLHLLILHVKRFFFFVLLSSLSLRMDLLRHTHETQWRIHARAMYCRDYPWNEYLFISIFYIEAERLMLTSSVSSCSSEWTTKYREMNRRKKINRVLVPTLGIVHVCVRAFEQASEGARARSCVCLCAYELVRVCSVFELFLFFFSSSSFSNRQIL